MNLKLGSSQSWDPKGGLQKEIPIFPLTAKLGGETTGGMFTENKSYYGDLINRTQAYSGDEQRQHTKNTGPKQTSTLLPNVQATQSTLWDTWRKSSPSGWTRNTSPWIPSQDASLMLENVPKALYAQSTYSILNHWIWYKTGESITVKKHANASSGPNLSKPTIPSASQLQGNSCYGSWNACSNNTDEKQGIQ